MKQSSGCYADIVRMNHIIQKEDAARATGSLGAISRRQAISSIRVSTVRPALRSWIICSTLSPACPPATASLAKIRQDRFNVSYEKDGARLDKALGTGSLLDDFLKETCPLLHSLTHSGTAQLGMRFEGNNIGANVSDGQMLALLNASSNAGFLVIIIVAQHYDMQDVAQACRSP